MYVLSLSLHKDTFLRPFQNLSEAVKTTLHVGMVAYIYIPTTLTAETGGFLLIKLKANLNYRIRSYHKTQITPKRPHYASIFRTVPLKTTVSADKTRQCCQIWWCRPITLRRLEQEVHKFKASLGNSVRACLKT